MVWQATPYTPTILLVGVWLVGIGGYLHWVHRSDSRGVRLASVLLVLSGGYVLAHAAQQAAAGLVLSRRLRYVEYLFALVLPAAWLAFVCWYTGRRRWLSRRLFGGLAAVAGVTAFAMVTTTRHGLFWRSTELVDVGSHLVLATESGPLVLLFLLYTYGIHLAAGALLAGVVVQSRGPFRRQAAALLFVGLLPAVLGLWYPTEVNPFPGLNISAVSMALTAGVLVASMRRLSLLDLDPVPRDLAFDALREGVVALSRDGRVVDYNRTAARLFVGGDDDPTGEPLAALLPDLAEELADAEPGERNEFELTTARGERVFEATVTASDSAVPRDGGRLVVLHDVTARVRERERLDEFASIVSHDLRSPLSVAAGRLRLARETGDAEHFDAAERAHDRMDALVEDLLTLAREGRTVAETEPVEVAAAARDAWRDVPADGASLELPEDPGAVLADRPRLTQLLGNLLRNAVEHGSTSPRSPAAHEDAVEHGSTSPHPSVAREDSVEHGGDGVTVRVEPLPDGFAVVDDGPGIDAAHREQVFEGGFTTSEAGSGLGLAIVARIAGAHGWDVAVTEGEAGGARFEVTGVERPAQSESPTAASAR